MKSKLLRLGKSSVSVLLTVMIIVSCLAVGIVSVNAWTYQTGAKIYFDATSWNESTSNTVYCAFLFGSDDQREIFKMDRISSDTSTRIYVFNDDNYSGTWNNGGSNIMFFSSSNSGWASGYQNNKGRADIISYCGGKYTNNYGSNIYSNHVYYFRATSSSNNGSLALDKDYDNGNYFISSDTARNAGYWSYDIKATSSVATTAGGTYSTANASSTRGGKVAVKAAYFNNWDHTSGAGETDSSYTTATYSKAAKSTSYTLLVKEVFSGYKFDGWATSATGSVVSTSTSYTPSSVLTGTTTYYAKFSKLEGATVYAKDGMVRTPTSGDTNTYEWFTDHANTTMSGDYVSGSYSDSSSYEYSTAQVKAGKTITVTTTIDAGYADDFYVVGWDVNGETYGYSKDGATSTTTSAKSYSFTYTVPTDASDGDVIAITPVYYYTNSYKTANGITTKEFIVKEFDSTVQARWGKTLYAYPFYDGLNNKSNSFGGYPGQPMLNVGGDLRTEVPLTFSNHNIQGITVNNGYWDDINRKVYNWPDNNDSSYNSNYDVTGTDTRQYHYQTYDSRDFGQIAQLSDVTKIVMHFKWETAGDNTPYTNMTASNGWEYLTDENGYLIDMFGNKLYTESGGTRTYYLLEDYPNGTGLPTAFTSSNLQIISSGYDRTGGQTYANRVTTKTASTQNDPQYYPTTYYVFQGTTFKFKVSPGALIGASDSTYNNKAVKISYEKNIFASSLTTYGTGGNDKANRCDMRWTYAKNEPVRVQVKAIANTSGTTINVDNFGSYTPLTLTESTGVATNTGIEVTAKHTDTTDFVTTNNVIDSGYVPYNETKNFDLHAAGDAGGNYSFQGWYKLENGKYTLASADPDFSVPRDTTSTYVAVFAKADSNSLKFAHKLYYDNFTSSDSPEPTSSDGTTSMTVELLRTDGSVYKTYTSENNGVITIPANILNIQNNHDYKIKVTMKATPQVGGSWKATYTETKNTAHAGPAASVGIAAISTASAPGGYTASGSGTNASPKQYTQTTTQYFTLSDFYTLSGTTYTMKAQKEYYYYSDFNVAEVTDTYKAAYGTTGNFTEGVTGGTVDNQASVTKTGAPNSTPASSVTAAAKTGYTFLGWYDGLNPSTATRLSTNTSYAHAITGGATYYALFIKNYTLTTGVYYGTAAQNSSTDLGTKDTNGSVTGKTITAGSTYDHSTGTISVSLSGTQSTAQANVYHFKGWLVDGTFHAASTSGYAEGDAQSVAKTASHSVYAYYQKYLTVTILDAHSDNGGTSFTNYSTANTTSTMTSGTYGSAVKTIYVPTETKITINPGTHTGYHIDTTNPYRKGSATGATFTSNSTTITEDTNLYVRYIIDSHTLTTGVYYGTAAQNSSTALGTEDTNGSVTGKTITEGSTYYYSTGTISVSLSGTQSTAQANVYHFKGWLVDGTFHAASTSGYAEGDAQSVVKTADHSVYAYYQKYFEVKILDAYSSDGSTFTNYSTSDTTSTMTSGTYGSAVKTIYVPTGTKITINPGTHTGYHIDATNPYRTGSATGATFTSNSTTITTDTNLFVRYIINSNTLTVKVQVNEGSGYVDQASTGTNTITATVGGTAKTAVKTSASYTVAQGTAISFSNSAGSGYRFVGYVPETPASTMPNSNYTVIAKFIRQYSTNVVIKVDNDNDGVYDDTTPDGNTASITNSGTQDVGTTISFNATPSTAKYYTFVGWSKTAKSGNDWTSSDLITTLPTTLDASSAGTYYALFKKETITVKMYYILSDNDTYTTGNATQGDAALVNGEQTVTLVKGTNSVAFTNTPPLGYTYQGVYKDNSGSNLNGTTPSNLTSDTNYYTRFKKISNTISIVKRYRDNSTATVTADPTDSDNTATATPTTVLYDSSSTLSAKPGDDYNFIGFYSDSACTSSLGAHSTNASTNTSTIIKNNITAGATYYALFEHKPVVAKLTIKVYDSSSYQTQGSTGTNKANVGGTTATGNTTVSVDVPYNTTVTYNNAVNASGYSFKGFVISTTSLNASTTGANTVTTGKLTSDVEYYALFKKQYTPNVIVKVDTNNDGKYGKTDDETASASGNTATVTSNGTAADVGTELTWSNAPNTTKYYVFVGWSSVDKTSTGQWTSADLSTPPSTLTGNVTYYALFKKAEVTATMKYILSDSNSWDTSTASESASYATVDGSVTSKSVVKGSNSFTFGHTDQTGYDFKGYYYANGTSAGTSGSNITADTTYYAHFQKKQITLTTRVKLNGNVTTSNEFTATVNGNTSATVLYNSKATFAHSTTNTAKYTFLGWTDDNTANVKYSTDSNMSNVAFTTDTTLTALFSTNQVTVTIAVKTDENGGTNYTVPSSTPTGIAPKVNSKTSDTIDYGSTADFARGLTSTYYTFKGWELDGTVYDANNTTDAEIEAIAFTTNKTVYGLYQRKTVSATAIVRYTDDSDASKTSAWQYLNTESYTAQVDHDSVPIATSSFTATTSGKNASGLVINSGSLYKFVGWYTKTGTGSYTSAGSNATATVSNPTANVEFVAVYQKLPSLTLTIKNDKLTGTVHGRTASGGDGTADVLVTSNNSNVTISPTTASGTVTVSGIYESFTGNIVLTLGNHPASGSGLKAYYDAQNLSGTTMQSTNGSITLSIQDLLTGSVGSKTIATPTRQYYTDFELAAASANVAIQTKQTWGGNWLDEADGNDVTSGGVSVKQVNGSYNQQFVLTPVEKADGSYRFVGWYNGNTQITSGVDSTTNALTITLGTTTPTYTARFERKFKATVSIKITADGGYDSPALTDSDISDFTGVSVSVDPTSYQNMSASEIFTATRTGTVPSNYVFKGWYLDNSSMSNTGTSATADGKKDHAFVALFQKIAGVVTAVLTDENGGSNFTTYTHVDGEDELSAKVDGASSKNINYNGTATFTTTGNTDEYTFVGWRIGDDTTHTYTTAQMNATQFTASSTSVYALYRRNLVTADAQVKYLNGNVAASDYNNPDKWLSNTPGGESYTATITSPSGTPKSVPINTLQFTASTDGMNSSNQLTIKGNSKYKFVGWVTYDGTTYTNVAAAQTTTITKPTSDYTFYAIYAPLTAKSITVTNLVLSGTVKNVTASGGSGTASVASVTSTDTNVSSTVTGGVATVTGLYESSTGTITITLANSPATGSKFEKYYDYNTSASTMPGQTGATYTVNIADLFTGTVGAKTANDRTYYTDFAKKAASVDFAIQTRETYAGTFDQGAKGNKVSVDSGTATTTPASVTKLYGDTVTLKATPKDSSYEFIKWVKNGSNFTGNTSDEITITLTDTDATPTYTAYFQKKFMSTVEVKVSAKNGDLTDTLATTPADLNVTADVTSGYQSMSANTTFTASYTVGDGGIPAKYEFVGWYVDNSTKGTGTSQTADGKSDHTFIALFKQVWVTVDVRIAVSDDASTYRYQTNEGNTIDISDGSATKTVTGGNTESVEVLKGENIVTITNAVGNGNYSFSKLIEDTGDLSTYAAAANVSVPANLTATKHYVALFINGVTLNVGVKTNEDGTGNSFSAYTGSDLHAYIGTTGTETSQTITAGESRTLRYVEESTELTNDDYDFVGWYREDSTDVYLDNGTTYNTGAVNSTTTYYAYFQRRTVTASIQYKLSEDGTTYGNVQTGSSIANVKNGATGTTNASITVPKRSNNIIIGYSAPTGYRWVETVMSDGTSISGNTTNIAANKVYEVHFVKTYDATISIKYRDTATGAYSTYNSGSDFTAYIDTTGTMNKTVDVNQSISLNYGMSPAYSDLYDFDGFFVTTPNDGDQGKANPTSYTVTGTTVVEARFTRKQVTATATLYYATDATNPSTYTGTATGSNGETATVDGVAGTGTPKVSTSTVSKYDSNNFSFAASASALGNKYVFAGWYQINGASATLVNAGETFTKPTNTNYDYAAVYIPAPDLEFKVEHVYYGSEKTELSTAGYTYQNDSTALPTALATGANYQVVSVKVGTAANSADTLTASSGKYTINSNVDNLTNKKLFITVSVAKTGVDVYNKTYLAVENIAGGNSGDKIVKDVTGASTNASGVTTVTYEYALTDLISNYGKTNASIPGDDLVFMSDYTAQRQATLKIQTREFNGTAIASDYSDKTDSANTIQIDSRSATHASDSVIKAPGTSTTFRTVVDSSYTFDGWYEVSGSTYTQVYNSSSDKLNTTYTFNLDPSKDYVARFTKKTVDVNVNIIWGNNEAGSTIASGNATPDTFGSGTTVGTTTNRDVHFTDSSTDYTSKTYAYSTDYLTSFYSTPTNSSYIFGGWYILNGSNYERVATTDTELNNNLYNLTADRTLYAYYQKLQSGALAINHLRYNPAEGLPSGVYSNGTGTRTYTWRIYDPANGNATIESGNQTNEVPSDYIKADSTYKIEIVFTATADTHNTFEGIYSENTKTAAAESGNTLTVDRTIASLFASTAPYAQQVTEINAYSAFKKQVKVDVAIKTDETRSNTYSAPSTVPTELDGAAKVQSAAEVYVDYNETADPFSATAETTNYEFKGWYVADGTTIRNTAYVDALEFTEDTTVYALYQRKAVTVTVKYRLSDESNDRQMLSVASGKNGSGGTPSVSFDVPKGSNEVILTANAVTGYTFNKWVVGSASGSDATNPDTNITADTTYVALYTKRQINIQVVTKVRDHANALTYTHDPVATANPTSVAYGGTTELIPNDLADYHFIGFYGRYTWNGYDAVYPETFSDEITKNTQNKYITEPIVTDADTVTFYAIYEHDPVSVKLTVMVNDSGSWQEQAAAGNNSVGFNDYNDVETVITSKQVPDIPYKTYEYNLFFENPNPDSDHTFYGFAVKKTGDGYTDEDILKDSMSGSKLETLSIPDGDYDFTESYEFVALFKVNRVAINVAIQTKESPTASYSTYDGTTLKVQINNRTAGKSDSLEVNSGATATLKYTNGDTDHYQFDGWYSVESGETYSDSGSGYTTPSITSEVTYYARFSRLTVHAYAKYATSDDNSTWTTPAANASYARVADSAQTSVEGAEITVAKGNNTLTLAHPSAPEGYSFYKWVLTDTSGNEVSNANLNNISADTTYVALFLKQYKAHVVVEVDSNRDGNYNSTGDSIDGNTATVKIGDDNVDNVLQNYGTEVTFAASAGENYTFEGWFTSGGTKIDETNPKNVDLTSDITYYARFVKDAVGATVKVQYNTTDTLTGAQNTASAIFTGATENFSASVAPTTTYHGDATGFTFTRSADTDRFKFAGWYVKTGSGDYVENAAKGTTLTVAPATNTYDVIALYTLRVKATYKIEYTDVNNVVHEDTDGSVTGYTIGFDSTSDYTSAGSYADYDSSKNVKVKLNAESGVDSSYKFSGWTVNGAPEDGTVSSTISKTQTDDYEFIAHFELDELNYEITYTFPARKNGTGTYETKTYTARGRINASELDTNGLLKNQFVLDNKPYEANYLHDIIWSTTATNIGKKADGTLTASLSATQTGKTFKVTYRNEEGIDESKTGIVSGTNAEDLDISVPWVYNDVEFSYWEIYTANDLGQPIAAAYIGRCYYPTFNFTIRGNYYIEPVYNGHIDLSAGNQEIQMNLEAVTRNQWDDGDKVWIDYNLMYNAANINLQDSTRYKPYMAVEVIDDSSTAATSIESIEAQVKASNFGTISNSATGTVIAVSKVTPTNKNRGNVHIQINGFNNSTRKNARVYAYALLYDTQTQTFVGATGKQVEQYSTIANYILASGAH